MEARLNIDWGAPWFAPWRDVGEPVLAAWSTRPLHAALGAAADIRFAPHTELPEREPYESFVFRTRRVPTRDNAHDFFNGLAWLRFPAIKAALNELQAAEIARDGVGGRRGPLRDAVTQLDENGAFLDGPEDLRDALLARDWRRLFIGLRPRWNEVRVTVFGHALLEKLLVPRKDLAAHVWCGPPEFTADRMRAKPFTPLPLMGIPGWDAGNGNFSFYDDPLVFRARRPITHDKQPARRPEP